MKSDWTRTEKLALYSLFVAIIGIGIALLNQEFRQTLGLSSSVANAPQKVTSTPYTSTKGNFQVYATSSEGTVFLNPYNNFTLFHFLASGQWTYWDKIGFHSASGHKDYPVASSDYPIPSKPPGSLIVRRSNGNYEYIGEEKTIRVEPNERIVFLINEDFGQAVGDGLKDNKGSLTINWDCQNCN